MRLLIVLLLLSILAFAANVICAQHNSPCYDTGQVSYPGGHEMHLYHCACGDEYWVQH